MENHKGMVISRVANKQHLDVLVPDNPNPGSTQHIFGMNAVPLS